MTEQQQTQKLQNVEANVENSHQSGCSHTLPITRYFPKANDPENIMANQHLDEDTRGFVRDVLERVLQNDDISQPTPVETVIGRLASVDMLLRDAENNTALLVDLAGAIGKSVSDNFEASQQKRQEILDAIRGSIADLSPQDLAFIEGANANSAEAVRALVSALRVKSRAGDAIGQGAVE